MIEVKILTTVRMPVCLLLFPDATHLFSISLSSHHSELSVIVIRKERERINMPSVKE